MRRRLNESEIYDCNYFPLTAVFIVTYESPLSMTCFGKHSHVMMTWDIFKIVYFVILFAFN